ncbi:HEPN domain-containing protein [Ensifer adhaerens]|uniref:HEPN domain-containing protein n=1 Tax=Ensifer adhaerens TaxID=106592 RepID=A0A9Q8YJB1_ENSAD|nr:HEPN domain-containing protein [Ensifer adhaerens]USJ28499.1 HEPN domain-containing protein [Ensifer adhaerens]
MRFTAQVGGDHRCVIKFDPIDKDTYLLLHQTRGRAGQQHSGFELRGVARNGDSFVSTGAYVQQLGGGRQGWRLKLALQNTTITVGLKEGPETPILRRHFRAFRSHLNPIHQTSLGHVVVYGTHEAVAPDTVSGHVAIQALDAETDPVAWREEAGSFLSHMHSGLSFAHGGRLQVAQEDFIAGGFWTATFHSGIGFAPELPLQDFLNHGPFIDALVKGYFESGPLNDGYSTALGWLQLPTTFDEVRFLSAMTALEVIVDTQLPKAEKGGMMVKSDFRALRDKLNAAIDAELDVDPDARAIMKAKIEDANKKVLSQKIKALFKHLAVPTRDFDDATIKRLTAVRNEIVHRGEIPDRDLIWREIVLIRELINRILMGAIGYSGRYCCYVDGEHERTFPDLQPFPPAAG